MLVALGAWAVLAAGAVGGSVLEAQGQGLSSAEKEHLQPAAWAAWARQARWHREQAWDGRVRPSLEGGRESASEAWRCGLGLPGRGEGGQGGAQSDAKSVPLAGLGVLHTACLAEDGCLVGVTHARGACCQRGS